MDNQFPDYFELFSIPRAYDIDFGLLTKNYRSLAQTVHPDRFANSSPAEQLAATNRSAELNDAREMLVNPVTRAQYLMKIYGFLPWGIDSESQTETDEMFLYKQLEYRERLEEVKNNNENIENLLSDINKDFFVARDMFRTNFPDGNVSTLKKAIVEMQFLQKLSKDVEELLP